jgi:hypothetical protein
MILDITNGVTLGDIERVNVEGDVLGNTEGLQDGLPLGIIYDNLLVK